MLDLLVITRWDSLSEDSKRKEYSALMSSLYGEGLPLQGFVDLQMKISVKNPLDYKRTTSLHAGLIDFIGYAVSHGCHDNSVPSMFIKRVYSILYNSLTNNRMAFKAFIDHWMGLDSQESRLYSYELSLSTKYHLANKKQEIERLVRFSGKDLMDMYLREYVKPRNSNRLNDLNAFLIAIHKLDRKQLLREDFFTFVKSMVDTRNKGALEVIRYIVMCLKSKTPKMYEDLIRSNGKLFVSALPTLITYNAFHPSAAELESLVDNASGRYQYKLIRNNPDNMDKAHLLRLMRSSRSRTVEASFKALIPKYIEDSEVVSVCLNSRLSSVRDGVMHHLSKHMESNLESNGDYSGPSI